MDYTLASVPSASMPGGKDWLIIRTRDEILLLVRDGVITARALAACWSAIRASRDAALGRAA